MSNNGTVTRRRRSSVTAEDVPDPQVRERAQRRTFTAKYKLAILEEYERAGRAERGAILRRENLYSSLLAEWRQQRDRGALAALSARRGPKPGKTAANAAEAEIARLRAELDTAREVIRVQGETVRALGEALGRQRGDARERALRMIDTAIEELAPLIGVRAACAAPAVRPPPITAPTRNSRQRNRIRSPGRRRRTLQRRCGRARSRGH